MSLLFWSFQPGVWQDPLGPERLMQHSPDPQGRTLSAGWAEGGVCVHSSGCVRVVWELSCGWVLFLGGPAGVPTCSIQAQQAMQSGPALTSQNPPKRPQDVSTGPCPLEPGSHRRPVRTAPNTYNRLRHHPDAGAAGVGGGGGAGVGAQAWVS